MLPDVFFVGLAQHPALSERVKQQVKAADWQTFIIAVIVIVGGGYALVFAPNVGPDVKILIGGLIGSVVTFFFGNRIAGTAAATTIAAQQSATNGQSKGGTT